MNGKKTSICEYCLSQEDYQYINNDKKVRYLIQGECIHGNPLEEIKKCRNMFENCNISQEGCVLFEKQKDIYV